MAKPFHFDGPKPFASSSSLWDDEDAYSLLTQIKEKNPNVDVRSITVDENDVHIPTFATVAIISMLINIFHENNNHNYKSIDDGVNVINETIDCANAVYFKIMAMRKSRNIRLSSVSIISQSIGMHDVVFFDGDEDDDDVASAIAIDQDFIDKEVNDILSNTGTNAYAATTDDFLHVFKDSIDRQNAIRDFDLIIDDKYCLIKKKILIMCGIFRNNESEAAGLGEVDMHIEGLDQHYAESQFYEMRSIHKSMWHLFYAMDIPFLTTMLLWVENAYNKSPHEIIVSARPLFVCLKEYVEVNEPKQWFVSKKDTPHIERIKNPTKLTRARENNCDALMKLIKHIDAVSDVHDCEECNQYMKYILSNNDSDDSDHIPNVKEIHCNIARKLGKIKRRIHNLNKKTGKKFNSGESKKASSVPPIFKQVLSLAGTMCNLIHHQMTDPEEKKTKKPHKEMHENTKQLVNMGDFSTAFLSKDDIDVNTTEKLTILPLDFHDILSCPSYKSFIIEFNNQINNKTILSIHRIFIREKNKHVFVIIDLFTKDDNNPNAIGIAIVCHSIPDVIRYFNTSMYSNKKFSASVKLFKINKQQSKSVIRTITELIE
jgi:hypothetical protein